MTGSPDETRLRETHPGSAILLPRSVFEEAGARGLWKGNKVQSLSYHDMPKSVLASMRQETEKIFQRARWLQVGEGGNPFSIPVLSCEHTARELIYFTTEPFALGWHRGDGGRHYAGRSPARSIQASSIRRRGSAPPPEGPLFLAEVLEEKWDIFFYEPYLYIVHSWTGELGYRVRLEFGEGHFEAEVEADAWLADDDPELAVHQLNFIVASHSFDCLAIHPIPRSIWNDPCEIAKYSFAMYGRRGRRAAQRDALSALVANAPGPGNLH
jgi:hypothetical protein